VSVLDTALIAALLGIDGAPRYGRSI